MSKSIYGIIFDYSTIALTQNSSCLALLNVIYSNAPYFLIFSNLLSGYTGILGDKSNTIWY